MGKKKLGLILPGGGFHGPFQAGVLKFFEEKEIKFDYIVASSIGVINAAILGAKDGSAEKICKFWKNAYAWHFFYPAWKEALKNRRIDSIFSRDKVEKQILKFANIYNQRKDVLIEISALNLDTKRVEYIPTDVPYFKEALWAGIGIAPVYPAVFLPQKGHQYIDGGLGRNFMIQRCVDVGCEKIVVINLIETQQTRVVEGVQHGTIRPIHKVFWRTATLVIKRVFGDSFGSQGFDESKVLKIFSPSGTYFSMLMPSNLWFKRMIEAGYDEAERIYSASSFLSQL